jgi:leucyl-tRNA synthetase
MIGPEHIVLHLLYSRFFTKFLRDEGILKFDEPFLKMRHQGMILGPDGKKMSKSKGNVINPDEVIEKFGADTLRLYEMFMGPLEADKPWSVSAVAGTYRFLTRVQNLISEAMAAPASLKSESGNSTQRKLHQVIKKVESDIPKLKFNTAIAALMELVNVWESNRQSLAPDDIYDLILILAPFAPFMTEELAHQYFSDRLQPTQAQEKGQASVHQAIWPSYQPELALETEINLPVQVNGKLRATLTISPGQAEDKDQVVKLAQAHPNLEKWVSAQTVAKVIYVPAKVLNFVVR